MSMIDSLLSTVRGKGHRTSSRRRPAAAGRTLRLETLECRLPLSAATPTLALQLVEARSVLPDDATIGGRVADIRASDALAGGIETLRAAAQAGARDSSSRSAPAGLSAHPTPAIRNLLDEAEAVLSGAGAADDLLVCRPLKSAVGRGDEARRDNDSTGVAKGRVSGDAIVPTGQHIVRAPVIGPHLAALLETELANRGMAFEDLDSSVSGPLLLNGLLRASRMTPPATNGLGMNAIALATSSVSVGTFGVCGDVGLNAAPGDPTPSGSPDGLTTDPLTTISTDPGDDGSLPPAPGDDGGPPGPPGPGGVGTIGVQPQPVIVAFSATATLGNVWVFEGEVIHPTPWTLTVVFGGLLAGHSTSVYVDGTFNYSLILPAGANGIVSAQAIDAAGQGSNMAFEWIA